MKYTPDDAVRDPLSARYHAAAPEIAVDPATVLSAGKRRRVARTVGAVAVAAVALSGGGWAATSLPTGNGAPVATQGPTESTGEPSETATEPGDATLDPTDQVLALADELEENAQPVPEGMAFQIEGTDWLLYSNQVEIVGTERTSNPDGTIYQVEIQSGQRASLSVGEPMPDDAQRTEVGPMDQGRPDWAFQEDLPLDPVELRQTWLDSCGVDPSVGATEYRCVYVGMQETTPTATDDLAAAVLRVLAAEPDVEIERMTDMLGRDRIAATFDLPDEGLWSYLVNPETGRIDGVQTSDEYGTSVGTVTTEWVEPVTSH